MPPPEGSKGHSRMFCRLLRIILDPQHQGLGEAAEVERSSWSAGDREVDGGQHSGLWIQGSGGFHLVLLIVFNVCHFDIFL